jgi:seryl-tRNA synthetase
MRIKHSKKDKLFLHTLNGTGCAIPRTIIAIMEQFQRPDGGIDIPKVLHPYIKMLGFDPSGN